MKFYDDDGHAQADKAFEIAEELLLDSELPLVIRARCHMVLSTNDNHPLYLQHAHEAVRVLDEDLREDICERAFPDKQLIDARRLLEEAQKEAAKRATERAANPEEESSDEVIEDEVAEKKRGAEQDGAEEDEDTSPKSSQKRPNT